MTAFQRVVKYLAMAFAIFLVVSIIGGILSAMGIFFGFFRNDGVAEDITVYSVSSDITALDITINAADFAVKESEEFSVESNLKYLTVEEKDGVLVIKEDKKFGMTYTGAMLTLYIPESSSFENAKVVTGAGRLTADTLSADTLTLELGAGEVSIQNLIATASADIDGGAGKITVENGNLNNLELNMGVGQLNLTSALPGNSELDLGIGETNLTLIGAKDDYRIDVDKGVGNVTVDGVNTANNSTVGNGQNRVDIDGGVGAINVSFKEN